MPEHSTLNNLDEAASDAALWGRRATMTLILLLVLAGATGLLGVHTSSASAEAHGYTLRLDYPAVARAGLDTKWQVTVGRRAGFDKSITLAVTGDYFDIFETQGFFPDPSAATRDGSTLYLTFDAPKSDTFVLAYDAYIQPSSQQGRSGEVSVMDGDSRAVSVHFTTRLVP